MTRDALVSADSRSVEILKPFLEGKDLKPWRAEWRGLWLLYTHHGIKIHRYPAILDHLRQFKRKLEARATSAHHEWYELQQPQQAYAERYSRIKLMYPHFAVVPSFSRVEAAFWGNDKTYAIPVEDLFLLGVLGSAPAWFFLSGISQPKAGGFRELRVNYVERVPVPTASTGLREEIQQLAARLGNIATPAPEASKLLLDHLVAQAYGCSAEDESLIKEQSIAGQVQ